MAKVEIHVPNKGYEGYLGGVRFHNGIGVFEDVELAERLAEQFGYKVVKEEAPKPVKEDATEKPSPRKRKKAGE